MLSVRNLSKSFSGPRAKTVLQDINLELAAGDYVAVMGESGIGKSTLLNLIAGLDRPEVREVTAIGLGGLGLEIVPLANLPGAWVKHAAQGSALLADGLAGGDNADLVEALALRRASGTILDGLRIRSPSGFLS